MNEIVMKLMALAEHLKDKLMPKSITQMNLENGRLSSKTIDQQSYAVPESIHITIEGLYGMCNNNSEWVLIGKILDELHLNNCLWYCSPEYKASSGVIPKAIKGLIELGILFKTTKAHYYIVNPQYIRKGNLIWTIVTTAQAIHNNNGIDEKLLAPLKQVKEFKFTASNINGQTNNIDQNGLYGLEF